MEIGWANIRSCGAKNPGIVQSPKPSTTPKILHFQHHIPTPFLFTSLAIQYPIELLHFSNLIQHKSQFTHALIKPLQPIHIFFLLFFSALYSFFSLCASLSFFQHKLDRYQPTFQISQSLHILSTISITNNHKISFIH